MTSIPLLNFGCCRLLVQVACELGLMDKRPMQIMKNRMLRRVAVMTVISDSLHISYTRSRCVRVPLNGILPMYALSALLILKVVLQISIVTDSVGLALKGRCGCSSTYSYSSLLTRTRQHWHPMPVATLKGKSDRWPNFSATTSVTHFGSPNPL